MFEIGADGSIPVNFIMTGTTVITLRTVQTPKDCLLRPAFQATFKLLGHFADNLSGSSAGFLWHHTVEREQCRDQINVGFNSLQHFWFEQELFQSQSLDSVLLHYLDNRFGKIGADVS